MERQRKYLQAHWKKSFNRKIKGFIYRLRTDRTTQVMSGLLLAVPVIGLALFLMMYQSDNDYSRGVLALNTDKSHYIAGDTVMFLMASLDKNGNVLCHNNLKLEIKVPGKWKKEVLEYSQQHIAGTATCDPSNNVTNEPDYISRYKVTKQGTYQITLVNTDTGKKVKAEFKVFSPENSKLANHPSNFQLERYGASRINPVKSERYPMVIKVSTKQDFKGTLVETVPQDFLFSWIGPATVSQEGEDQTLTWKIDLKAGESKVFAYEYDVPENQLRFIRLNQAQLINDQNKLVFTESHGWQIASFSK